MERRTARGKGLPEMRERIPIRGPVCTVLHLLLAVFSQQEELSGQKQGASRPCPPQNVSTAYCFREKARAKVTSSLLLLAESHHGGHSNFLLLTRTCFLAIRITASQPSATKPETHACLLCRLVAVAVGSEEVTLSCRAGKL